MSIELEKINLISDKVNVLIGIKNHQDNEIERLNEELKTLKEERFTLADQNSNLEKEIELLKTTDRTSPDKSDNLDEVKISGMIKEIEECLALLKS
ncbi:MAG: putative nuclease with TOPRIM domain [Urechidicola sp.]|jgi:predicted nuclease with TOPRIM domain|tara:strand:+ start:1958 stop:2245 length:288 start_codon:yes stop_codon:yes gene_type:complete